MGFFTSLFGFSSEDKDLRTEAIIDDFNQAISAREKNKANETLAKLEKSSQISDKFFRFIGAEDFDQALDFINSALESISDDYSLFEQKSLVLRLMEKYDEAIDVLEDALNRFPGDRFSLYRKKAEILMELENYSETINCLSRAVEFALADGETDSFSLTQAYSERGDAYLKSDNYPLALADYHKAIELDPKYSYLYIKRSDVYLAMGAYPQALNDINQSLKLEGEKATSNQYCRRGKIYAESGDNEKAIDDYTTAIALSQNEEFGVKPNLERGKIYLKTGHFTLALEDFSEAIREYPDYWSEPYKKRAEVYQRLGQNSLASADLERADLLEMEESETQF